MTPLGSISFAQEERASGHSLPASPLAVGLLTHVPCGMGEWVGRRQQVSSLHEHACFKDTGDRLPAQDACTERLPFVLRSPSGGAVSHFTDPKGYVTSSRSYSRKGQSKPDTQFSSLISEFVHWT